MAGGAGLHGRLGAGKQAGRHRDCQQSPAQHVDRPCMILGTALLYSVNLTGFEFREFGDSVP